MGYMRHHAIIVTSRDDVVIEKAHGWAMELFAPTEVSIGEDPIARDWSSLVSPIALGVVNDQRSFAVFPDGSKEGWGTSDHGDMVRDALISLLDGERYSDGSSALDWVLVQFGDDDGDTRVLRDSDERKRSES